MKNYGLALMVSLIMITAGCAAPMAKRSADPNQQRPASGLMGTMTGGQQPNQPPDQPPQDPQPQK